MIRSPLTSTIKNCSYPRIRWDYTSQQPDSIPFCIFSLVLFLPIASFVISVRVKEKK